MMKLDRRVSLVRVAASGNSIAGIAALAAMGLVAVNTTAKTASPRLAAAVEAITIPSSSSMKRSNAEAFGANCRRRCQSNDTVKLRSTGIPLQNSGKLHRWHSHPLSGVLVR